MSSSPILFAIFLVFLVGLALVRFYQVKKKEHKKRLVGLNTLAALIHIIKLTQQHRGLQSGLLNGQTTALTPLTAIEDQISQGYLDLINNAIEIDNTSTKLISIASAQWQSLLRSPHQNIDKNFHQHSRLIQRLLDCLWDLADEYALTSHRNQHVQDLAHDLVRTLPELTEAIGQVRAITLQVSNSKHCSADKKLQLLFTLSKIKRDLPQIQEKLESQSFRKLVEFIEDIARSVEDQALGNRNPDIFFKEASLHIDMIFHYINTGLNDLKKQVIHHA